MADNPVEILKWLAEAGDDLALAEAPINRFEESEKAKAAPRTFEGSKSAGGGSNSGGDAQRSKTRANIAARAKAVAGRLSTANRQDGMNRDSRLPDARLPDESVVEQARELAARADTIEALRKTVEDFDGCNLKPTAKHTVFADGNPDAKVMFVGEAPGRDEDLQGLPFVGRSGQLLDKMLAAIGLDRERVYITNLIFWRPPGNRAPTPAESAICRPFVERHIELVAPKILVLVGGSSAKSLLQTDDGILRMRGQWKEFTPAKGGKPVATIATLHPSYLLRQPAQKALAWQDLLQIKAKLAELS